MGCVESSLISEEKRNKTWTINKDDSQGDSFSIDNKIIEWFSTMIE